MGSGFTGSLKEETMAGKIYVAVTDALIETGDGNNIILRGGVTRVREGHPLLENRESLFKEIDVHYDVETARQAPKAEAKPAPAAKPEPVPATKADEEYASPPAKKTAGLTSESAPKAPGSTSRRGPRKTS